MQYFANSMGRWRRDYGGPQFYRVRFYAYGIARTKVIIVYRIVPFGPRFLFIPLLPPTFYHSFYSLQLIIIMFFFSLFILDRFTLPLVINCKFKCNRLRGSRTCTLSRDDDNL